MLHAILSSKAGRLHSSEDSVRWRDIFKGSEDLITATLFERLAYLSGPTAWALLRAAMGGHGDTFRMAELAELEFWPMWPHKARTMGVEPDVFLQFDLGDPAQRFHVIVESKFAGNGQSSEQWAVQLSAYAQLLSEDLTAADHVVYLAIDGISKGEQWQKDMLEAVKAHPLVQEANVENVSFEMCDWKDLAKACATTKPATPQERRILGDMTKALGLFGYHHVIRPKQLEDMKPLATVEQSLAMLSKRRA
ncbi:hypothetical protein KO498_16835 [Lentibacter algarum]|uniref:hypothetical protein n=1 Tax=Lentibacter algarum TaxID=576131 RepID=UPI001C08D2B2|nr:hypothetical protein [Lentibacter algarum]MBU2983474.1 hypothetical protein [Lentibacter algarum]